MTRPFDVWSEVSAARLPAAYLNTLAVVRDHSDIRVHFDGPDVWVRWSPGRLDVVRYLLSVPGVEFFTRRVTHWFRFGCRTPTSVVPPTGDGQPLPRVILPARFDPVSPEPTSGTPVVLQVVRGGIPRPVTALACATAALHRWVYTATTAELAAVRAARSGERTVLLGSRLPVLPGGTRYWGDDLLVPVGFRPDPDLPAAVLRAACGAESDELVILDEGGSEVIPRAAFEPLTRAGLRLALRDVAGLSVP